MYQPLHPGIHVRRVRNAPPAPTRIDVPAFVGIAGRGPLGRVAVIEGWPQFVARYGDFQVNAFMAYAVRGFFDNGGLRCHILRVAAPALETETSGAQPADRASSNLADTARVRPGAVATLVQSSATQTQGAQPADRKSSVVASAAGMVAGNMALLQQPGVAPVRREIVAVDGGTPTLSWGEPVPAEFDLTQPLAVSTTARDARLVASVAGPSVAWTRPLDGRFDLATTIHVGFGAAVASGIIHDESGDPLLSVEAAEPGRWGERLSVRVTTRVTGDYATRQKTVPDPADRLSLDRVDGMAVGACIEVSQDGAPTVATLIAAVKVADLQVVLADPLAGFDPAGAADGTKPILIRRRAATFSVSEGGRLIETHPDMDLPPPGAPDASAVNDSSHAIRIARLPSAADRWIDPASPLLDRGVLRLTGGRDGIAMLEAADFAGVAGGAPTGLTLLREIAEPAAIAMPDILLPEMPARETLAEKPPEPDPCALCRAAPPSVPATQDVLVEASPAFAQATVESIQRAMVEFCEARGDILALLDPPLAPSGECLDWPELIRWRQRFDTSLAATYHPWIDVADPLDRTGRLIRRVPPSGHALGQFAQADRDPGRAAPANRRLGWTVATACDIGDERHTMLNERGINAITVRQGRGIRIMGARTLASHPDWQQLTVRRLFIRLNRAFRRELAWAVFEPANRAFEQRVIATLELLLELEWQAGRIRGSRPEDAFRVVIDRDAGSVDNGEFVVLVAVAPSLPAEFVFLRLTFTLDQMNLAELTASGGWPA